MTDDRDRGKVFEFPAGVRPSTRRLDDGAEEIVPRSYRIETAAGQVCHITGVNLATVREYKRILDEGFSDAELESIGNRRPFSNDPEVDCDAITGLLGGAEQMFVGDLASYLEDLILAIVAPGKRDRMTAHLGAGDLLAAIRKAAARIRTPANLDIAEKLGALEITGDGERDRGAIEEILDFLAERKVTKMPDT